MALHPLQGHTILCSSVLFTATFSHLSCLLSLYGNMVFTFPHTFQVRAAVHEMYGICPLFFTTWFKNRVNRKKLVLAGHLAPSPTAARASVADQYFAGGGGGGGGSMAQGVREAALTVSIRAAAVTQNRKTNAGVPPPPPGRGHTSSIPSGEYPLGAPSTGTADGGSFGLGGSTHRRLRSLLTYPTYPLDSEMQHTWNLPPVPAGHPAAGQPCLMYAGASMLGQQQLLADESGLAGLMSPSAAVQPYDWCIPPPAAPWGDHDAGDEALQMLLQQL